MLLAILILLLKYVFCQSTNLTPDVVFCPDVDVTFTCRTPQESPVLSWRVTLLRDRTKVMGQPVALVYSNSVMLGDETVTVPREGLSFHFSFVETSPSILSTMRTSLPLSMNKTRVECVPNTLLPSLIPDESTFFYSKVLQSNQLTVPAATELNVINVSCSS